MSRSTAWYPATAALKRMMSTTTTPARSSTLPYPNVKRLLAPKRVSAKAIPRGMAVAASPKLWMVSDSSATLPDSSTTASCRRAVAASIRKDHFTAQMPRSEVAMVGSTAPWVWPCSACPWSWQCSSSCKRVTAAILPLLSLCTRVRGRRILRSWTSHKRSSGKFEGVREPRVWTIVTGRKSKKGTQQSHVNHTEHRHDGPMLVRQGPDRGVRRAHHEHGLLLRELPRRIASDGGAPQRASSLWARWRHRLRDLSQGPPRGHQWVGVAPGPEAHGRFAHAAGGGRVLRLARVPGLREGPLAVGVPGRAGRGGARGADAHPDEDQARWGRDDRRRAELPWLPHEVRGQAPARPGRDTLRKVSTKSASLFTHFRRRGILRNPD